MTTATKMKKDRRGWWVRKRLPVRSAFERVVFTDWGVVVDQEPDPWTKVESWVVDWPMLDKREWWPVELEGERVAEGLPLLEWRKKPTRGAGSNQFPIEEREPDRADRNCA